MKKSTCCIFGMSFTFLLFSTHTQAQTATIDLAVRNQYIRGFGGMNNPGWIADLTTAQANKAFGVGDGKIGLSVLRIRVPSDATQFYKEYPTVATARSLGVTVFATPWSPPASMKSNNNIVKGTLNTNSYGAYAAHLKSFSDYMISNKAPLYAISLQNEPDWLPDYESCSWTSTQFNNFLKGYGSAVGNNLIVAESLNLNHSLTDPILNDSAACSKILIIGGHLYGSGLASYPLAKTKGKELWMTEHITDTDSANLWSGAMILGKEIHDCMVAGFNVYTWWYIRRYYGPMDDNGNITKRGYVMSQFARFVRPGFTRVSATTSSASNIDVTAYKKGANVVIVTLNRNAIASNLTFTFQNGTVTNFTRYTTSATKNISKDSTFKVSGNSFSTTLLPLCITTFSYRDSLNMVPDANAGSDRIVTDTDRSGSESVTLNASGSSDADGKIVSYVWRENGSQIATGVNPSINLSAGIHTISLAVLDDSSAMATDTIKVLVNSPPIANAGPDQTITDNDNSGSESVTLDGSGSTDADGSIVSYLWSENGSQIATGVNPNINLVVGIHNITLTATDKSNATSTDILKITVNVYPNPPVAKAGPDQTVKDVDNSGTEPVILDGSGSTDADGTIISYIWTENNNQIANGVNPTINLASGTHKIKLTVTDNNNAIANDSITITINGPNGLDQNKNFSSYDVIIYPNPIISQADIEFTIEKAEYVTLVLTDITGREVQSLIKGIQPAGKHKITFNGNNLKSGIYFCMYITAEKQETIKTTIYR